MTYLCWRHYFTIWQKLRGTRLLARWRLLLCQAAQFLSCQDNTLMRGFKEKNETHDLLQLSLAKAQQLQVVLSLPAAEGIQNCIFILHELTVLLLQTFAVSSVLVLFLMLFFFLPSDFLHSTIYFQLFLCSILIFFYRPSLLFAVCNIYTRKCIKW